MVNKIFNVRRFEQPFGEKTRLVERQDIIHIVILVTITLVIGLYLIATTVLIAKDGTFYIELAKSITNNPVEAIHNIPCWGYPFLIHLAHKMTGLFYDATSLQGWIISAQAVSLASKIIASIVMYFVGSYFVGPRLSFWGVLILSVLPDSAEYGSDALSNWPNIMFLAIGFLLLLSGSQFRKNWLFGWAGITAGLGYLIRPECGQVVLYGSAWLLFNLIRPQGKNRRAKVVGALILLLAGFAVIAVPYMRSKGYVFPRQGMWKLPAMLSMSNNSNMCLAGLSPGKIIGEEALIRNMCETLLYYFVPALLIGCYYYFRRQTKTLEQTFFAAAFIVLNIVLLSWQISYQHFLSRRHTLALIAFTAFYIPIGIEIIAGWISERTSKGRPRTEKDRQRWFYILLFIGISICLPKLFKFTGTQKYGYRDAAEWLIKNTAPADIIAVPDKRIAFYAERQGLECLDDNIPRQVGYVVSVVKDGNEKLQSSKEFEEKYLTWADNRKNRKLIIYKRLQ